MHRKSIISASIRKIGSPVANDMKAQCRAGLPESERRLEWLQLVGIESNPTVSYLQATKQVFGTADTLPAKLFKIPFLGVEPTTVPESALHLLQQPSIALSAAHDRVVCVLAQLEGLRHCPMIPNLALLLLAYLNEAETFMVLEKLIHSSGERRMVFTSELDEDAFLHVFMRFLRARMQKVYDHLIALDDDGEDINQIFRAWFRNFFTGWLPHDDVFRVIDAYLSEGPKVLLRFALAWVKIRRNELLDTENVAQVEMALRNWVLGEGTSARRIPYRFSTLAHVGFSLRNLSRADVDKYFIQYKTNHTEGEIIRHLSTWRMKNLQQGKSTVTDDIRSQTSATSCSTTDEKSAQQSAPHVSKVLFRPPFLLNYTRPVHHGESETSSLNPSRIFELYGFYTPLNKYNESDAKNLSQLETRVTGKLQGSEGDIRQRLRLSQLDEDSARAIDSFMRGISRQRIYTYSVIVSRVLATLVTFLPRSMAICDWLPLYSTRRHPWSLRQLLSHVRGLAPVLLIAELRTLRQTKDSHTEPETTTIAVYSTHGFPSAAYLKHLKSNISSANDCNENENEFKIERHVSAVDRSESFRDQINRSSSAKMRTPQAPEAESANLERMINSIVPKVSHVYHSGRSPLTSFAPWVGATMDFVAQVSPDCTRYPVEARRTGESFINDSMTNSSKETKDTFFAKTGRLLQSRFSIVLESESYLQLNIGGEIDGGVPAISFGEDLQQATVSAEFARCLQLASGTPGTASNSNIRDLTVQVVSLEAHGFCDSLGRVHAYDSRLAKASLQLIAREERAYNDWKLESASMV